MSYQFFRKNTLPSLRGLVASSFYIVSPPGSDKASLHYVTANKSVKSFLNEDHVQAMIAASITKDFFVIDNEENLSDMALDKDGLVIVTGPVGDPANIEPKIFFYHVASQQFIHLNKNHFHQNKVVLDGIQENEDQQLVYRNGLVLNVSLCGSEW